MDKSTPEQLTSSAKNLTENLAVGAVEAIGQTKSSIDGNLDKARYAIEKGIDYLDTAHAQLDKHARRTARYVSDHPSQSLMIAAGVGALIFLLATLCAPKREDGYNEYRGRRW